MNLLKNKLFHLKRQKTNQFELELNLYKQFSYISSNTKQCSPPGVDMSETKEAHFTRSRGRSRSRSQSAPAAKRQKIEERGRSVSKPARDTTGVGNAVVSSILKDGFTLYCLIARKTSYCWGVARFVFSQRLSKL